MTANGKCALCGNNTELRLSHIVPKFVFSWFKETGGPIRGKHNPNLRVQDGVKEPLLCSVCEELFSGWEKPFCEKLFLPLHDNSSSASPVEYGPWALKCAVSISWRVLLYFSRLHDLSHFGPHQKESALEALEVWRRYLLGELQHPQSFEQHLVVVDVVQAYSGPRISPFLNRYLTRTVHADVPSWRKSAMVYAKMGRLILFGFIQGEPRGWKNSKLRVNKGSIMLGHCSLPQFVAAYLNEKADEAAKVLASVSPKQRDKIQKNILDTADRLAGSDVFRAMQYDVYHSGKRAFQITGSTNDETNPTVL